MIFQLLCLEDCFHFCFFCFLLADFTNQSLYFKIVNLYCILIVKLKHKQICFGSYQINVCHVKLHRDCLFIQNLWRSNLFALLAFHITEKLFVFAQSFMLFINTLKKIHSIHNYMCQLKKHADSHACNIFIDKNMSLHLQL